METATAEKIEPQVESGPQITEIKRSKVSDLVERVVFVSIRLGKPGVNKKISSEDITFDSESSDEGKRVDRDLISVTKRLIDCKEYKAISTNDTHIKKFIKSRCTESLVRDGIFLLPVALVNDVDSKVIDFKAKRQALIDAYGEVYDQRVNEALERLGPEGDRADYPPWSAVEQQFAFDLQYMTLQAPTVLGNINEKILEREQEKVAQQFKNAIENVKDSLRIGMADIVNSLAEQLGGTKADGKKKGLVKSSVEKMTDFLSVFDARNLADDAALAELVEKAKRLLEGTDIAELRKNEDIRADVAKGFAEIRDSLSKLVVVAPRRAVTFED